MCCGIYLSRSEFTGMDQNWWIYKNCHHCHDPFLPASLKVNLKQKDAGYLLWIDPQFLLAVWVGMDCDRSCHVLGIRVSRWLLRPIIWLLHVGYTDHPFHPDSIEFRGVTYEGIRWTRRGYYHPESDWNVQTMIFMEKLK